MVIKLVLLALGLIGITVVTVELLLTGARVTDLDDRVTTLEAQVAQFNQLKAQGTPSVGQIDGKPCSLELVICSGEEVLFRLQ